MEQLGKECKLNHHSIIGKPAGWEKKRGMNKR
jgi:hypothetical protein